MSGTLVPAPERLDVSEPVALEGRRRHRMSPRQNLDPWAVFLLAYLAICAEVFLVWVVVAHGPLWTAMALALPGAGALAGLHAAGLFGRDDDRADLDDALRRLAALEREYERLNADVRGGLVDA